MDKNNSLQVQNDSMYSKEKFEIIQRMGNLMSQSQMFPKDNNISCAVKIMAGAELGLPPFASITGIHIVQGRPTLGSNLIATLIKNSGRYDYKIKKQDNESCVLEWSDKSGVLGTSDFTYAEAEKAELTKKEVWKKYPSDMLFARALTRGARRYCPGIFGGTPIYTPEELNSPANSVNADFEILDGEASKAPSEPTDKPLIEKTTSGEIIVNSKTKLFDDLYSLASDYMNNELKSENYNVQGADVRGWLNAIGYSWCSKKYTTNGWQYDGYKDLQNADIENIVNGLTKAIDDPMCTESIAFGTILDNYKKSQMIKLSPETK